MLQDIRIVLIYMIQIKKNGKTYVCDPELAYEIPGRNWYMNTYASAPVSYTR